MDGHRDIPFDIIGPQKTKTYLPPCKERRGKKKEGQDGSKASKIGK